MDYISDNRLKSQKWKFYFVLVAWPVYLFILPYLYLKIGLLSVVFMIFPGIYLFTWCGFLMHESWHKYVPGLSYGFFYNVFAWMLFTDPQVYRMVHGGHHSNVNSWNDTEFHPIGKIENFVLRRIYNIFEIILGIAFITVITLFVVPFHPQYKAKYSFIKLFTSVVVWSAFLGSIGYLSYITFSVSVKQIIISFSLSLWINSIVLHHSQLVEHGNLIVDGDWKQRNIKTRNLKNSGIFEKIFIFLTHGDSSEHVLHHTLVGIYSRPFPGVVPMPQESVYITLRDYLGILRGMVTEK
ncbi:MAG: hypothetical protein A2539_10285 [Elusimicrobia bacterium RIFOXYD2_FULL_34_15]|nr:MAG: hypothetical protein A2539_10285 [Elusimicrobia bacterium RIFOXYD2_FULL_34_15]